VVESPTIRTPTPGSGIRVDESRTIPARTNVAGGVFLTATRIVPTTF
jgi:hypothetical protein